MSCEECKSQIFELIEREAVDPEGVRAILADCPECRAEFEAMPSGALLSSTMTTIQIGMPNPEAGRPRPFRFSLPIATPFESSVPAPGWKTVGMCPYAVATTTESRWRLILRPSGNRTPGRTPEAPIAIK